jgi:FlaA1/EpsC-like NDP-sugar epimerase
MELFSIKVFKDTLVILILTEVDMIRNVILKCIESYTVQTVLLGSAVFFTFSALNGQIYFLLLTSLILSRLICQNLFWYFYPEVQTNLIKHLFISIGPIAIDIATCLLFIPENDGLELGVISSILLSCSLLGTESLYEKLGNPNDKSQKKVKTLFYGSHENSLIKQFLENHGQSVENVGFIEDDSGLWGRAGDKKIFLGGIEKLEHFIVATEAQQVVIEGKDQSREKRDLALQICSKLNVVAIFLGDKIEQAPPFLAERSENFKLENLLNRPPVEVNLLPVQEMVSGKIVMVTGAGGSIGSELCRQIIQMKPAKLIIVDHSELNLYTIGQELKDWDNKILLLIDIKDQDSLGEVFFLYQPHILYHAAAYKHVHLVEENPYTSIVNNVLGTKNLIECALENNVASFVLISSDKAVNPSSVMGATKRVCELMVTRAAEISGRRYCSVRFGNVLGSSGSLIPLLKKQIQAGGPVTITDPQMTRYFMLISEAVKLVLKAGQISSPGDINVLKMGEPIKILELAKRVIKLMGRKEEEIPIIFIGKKPGEKLFEELYLTGNERNSEHPDILIVPNGDSAYDPSLFKGQELEFVVHKLIYLAYMHDEAALKLLKQLVFMHKKEYFNLSEINKSLSQAI